MKKKLVLIFLALQIISAINSFCLLKRNEYDEKEITMKIDKIIIANLPNKRILSRRRLRSRKSRRGRRRRCRSRIRRRNRGRKPCFTKKERKGNTVIHNHYYITNKNYHHGDLHNSTLYQGAGNKYGK